MGGGETRLGCHEAAEALEVQFLLRLCPYFSLLQAKHTQDRIHCTPHMVWVDVNLPISLDDASPPVSFSMFIGF